MGCGLDCCSGPSLAYAAAADISSRTSSKEERTTSIVAANRTVIIDLLRTHLAERRDRRDELDSQLAAMHSEIADLEIALDSLESIGR